MKIYNNKPNQLQDLTQQNLQKIGKPEARDVSKVSANSTPSDRVDISGRAKEIAELMSAINQIPEVRSDKVAEIKKAIESGNYNINTLKIAQSLLKEI
ncbi:MAG: flagellar biosynthesis anti-sigma factor FlgM [Thermodesulfovibrionales bacterium]|nr:flagellar biosynthesis anti-sigma factor FlgM [Thermodesulfovibrionales bacterium]